MHMHKQTLAARSTALQKPSLKERETERKVFNGDTPEHQPRAYIESFREHYPQLKDAICTDIGARLQSIDGRMM